MLNTLNKFITANFGKLQSTMRTTTFSPKSNTPLYLLLLCFLPRQPIKMPKLVVTNTISKEKYNFITLNKLFRLNTT